MAFVGEVLFSASVGLLLNKITSPEFKDFFRSKKLDVPLLDNLITKVLSLQAVLNDAEEKKITDPAVSEWLDRLKDAVFDTDDLLDEINTKASRWKVKAVSQDQNFGAKVRNFLSSYRAINSKMQTLLTRLEGFVRSEHLLRRKESVSSSVWHGTPTDYEVVQSAIYGRDDDKMDLKKYLLSDDASSNEIGVISIWGMGGVGKTTLANLLYHDYDVQQKFQVKAWASISKDLDVSRVTKTLLESITTKTNYTENMKSPQVELQKSLSHKRFLFVLDDIWDVTYVKWNNLKDILNAGEIGSRIIITTRRKSVALIMKTFLPIHHLKPLESEDCWSLLAKHAFGASNHQERSKLEVIGREIAKKCDGLPLAAVALGGLLRNKSSEDDWKVVLKSNIWDLSSDDVPQALLLSYQYLPAPLKQCFAYCSIFSKNSMLDKKTVVQLWIAEGLVHQSNNEKSMEEVGDEYFDELVSRSLIHQHSVDGEASFEMHDLINDLATKVSSSYCIRLDERQLHRNLERERHLSYSRGEYDTFNKFDTLYGLKGLRTFLALPLQEEWQLDYYLSNKVIHDLLPAMKQLRALSLSYYMNITELPNSIDNLIHLRYLNLSCTSIKRLPSVICKLYNLQTLLLSNCRSLIELPEDMGKLVNLRHLDISGSSLQEMPIQIAKLQNLQTLSDFFVSGQQDGLKVAELRKFPHLQGKLSISDLQNVTDPSDASQANLKMKEQIDEMTLRWGWYEHNTEATRRIESHVLEQLQPSAKLKNLTIDGYGGSKFPNWLCNSSFGKMVYLCIIKCHHCSSLPPLGQLVNLKELKIGGMKLVKSVGTEFYGNISASFQPFPSLETLSFSHMLEWEEWNFVGGTTTKFPILSHLSLNNCPKLKGNIPSKLPSLTELELRDCPLLESANSYDNNSNIVRPSNLFSQIMSFNSLRKLTINDFPSLKSFARDGLPKTLQSLDVDSCMNLEFLPQESLQNYTSLQVLKISNSCDSMTSFTLGSLPVLNILVLSKCKNLKWILVVEDVSQSLSFLRSLHIWDCNELESCCPGGLPAPNLVVLEVNRCEKLYSLPEPINTLTGLEQLSIDKLPNLRSFANEGLPINIRWLLVGGGNLSNTTAITEWCLERLTCLSELWIYDDDYDLVNTLMKMDVHVLPDSLVSLHISAVNIKCLDGKWLQHLTSLQTLDIRDCPNLKSLPKEGLPSSLSLLEISRCPLLKESCQKKRGKEWPKIARIPFIKIDSEIYSR